jgi:hypothetical protein
VSAFAEVSEEDNTDSDLTELDTETGEVLEEEEEKAGDVAEESKDEEERFQMMT